MWGGRSNPPALFLWRPPGEPGNGCPGGLHNPAFVFFLHGFLVVARRGTAAVPDLVVGATHGFLNRDLRRIARLDRSVGGNRRRRGVRWRNGELGCFLVHAEYRTHRRQARPSKTAQRPLSHTGMPVNYAA